MIVLRSLFYLPLAFRVYIGIFIIAFLSWLIAHRLGYIGSRSKRKSLPASTAHGNLISRLTEAIIMTCIVAVFIISSLRLALLRYFATVGDDVIRIYMIFITAICVAAALGIIITLLWRTSVGFAIIAITCVFSFF